MVALKLKHKIQLLKKNSQAEIATDEIFEFEGLKYNVGSTAIRDALTTRDYSFLEKYAPLLLFKSIQDAHLDVKQDIKLATGLSLLNWNKRNEFAERISDFVINKTHMNKINIKVIPQGKGIYTECLSYMPELKEQLVLIIDIGYYSADFLPFENGRALASEAWASNQGMNLVIDEMRKVINSNYGTSFNETQINEIIQSGSLSISGEKKDLSVLIQGEKHRYSEIILNEVRTKNHDLYKSADKIIISGGGAYTIVDIDLAEKNIIFSQSPYEFANVNGYFKELKNG